MHGTFATMWLVRLLLICYFLRRGGTIVPKLEKGITKTIPTGSNMDYRVGKTCVNSIRETG